MRSGFFLFLLPVAYRGDNLFLPSFVPCSSCDPVSSDVEWIEICKNLNRFAGKYLDRPQVLASEIHLSHRIFGEGEPELRGALEEQCPAGFLSLKILFSIFVSPSRVAGVNLLREVTNMFPLTEGGERSAAFPQVLKEWPVFSLLSALEKQVERLALSMPLCLEGGERNKTAWSDDQSGRDPPNEMRSFSPSFLNFYLDKGVWFPLSPVFQFLFSSKESFHFCGKVGRISGLLGLSLTIKNAVESSQDLKDFSFLFQHSSTKIEAYADQFRRSEDQFSPHRWSVEEAVNLFLRSSPHEVFLSGWPTFELLDLISLEEVVSIPRPLLEGEDGERRGVFKLHLFPHRAHSDGLIANYVRTLKEPYCAPEFMRILGSLVQGLRSRRKREGEEVERKKNEEATDHGGLNVVEMGPHLGDCLLWGASFPEVQKLVGIEPVLQLYRLATKSVHDSLVEEKVSFFHAYGAENVDEKVEPPRLSVDVVARNTGIETVDILKIHTNGHEAEILRGARSLINTGKVSNILIHSADPEELRTAINFLRSSPPPGFSYQLSYSTPDTRAADDEGQGEVKIQDDLVEFLNLVRARGGLQLIARLEAVSEY